MHRSSRFTWALLSAGLLAGAAAHAAEESKARTHESTDSQAHASAQQPKADDRQSNDRQIEITTEGANLWLLKTKSRLVKMRLVEQESKTFAEFLPFNYEGAAYAFGADNTLSLEIDPGTDRARLIPLRQEGKDGRLVTASPLSSKAAFDGALHMDEKDHVHRLRFRFPGAK